MAESGETDRDRAGRLHGGGGPHRHHGEVALLDDRSDALIWLRDGGRPTTDAPIQERHTLASASAAMTICSAAAVKIARTVEDLYSIGRRGCFRPCLARLRSLEFFLTLAFQCLPLEMLTLGLFCAKRRDKNMASAVRALRTSLMSTIGYAVDDNAVDRNAVIPVVPFGAAEVELLRGVTSLCRIGSDGGSGGSTLQVLRPRLNDNKGDL